MNAKETKPANGEKRSGYGPHVTTSELEDSARLLAKGEAVISWQLMSHLNAGCTVCLERVEQALGDRLDCYWMSPLLSALARLVLPSAELEKLPPMERAAVQEIGDSELGFAFLLLEVTAGQRDLNSRDLDPWWGLIAANAAVVEAPAATHDLVARYMALTGRNLCRQKQLTEAERAVALARDHAREGRGGGEPMASVVETAALVAAGQPDQKRCRTLVDEALALLAEHPFPDRRAEVLFNVERALGQHGESTRKATLALLKLAAAEIDTVEPNVNPPPEPTVKTMVGGRYQLYRPLSEEGGEG